jgi:putative oxidoreductase
MSLHTLLHPARHTPVLSDVALLIARVGVGVVLLAHGWQKYNEYTLAGTTGAFEGMGVPLPGLAAVFVTTIEIVGGLALIVGLLTPMFALLNMVSMLGALLLVHAPNGVFVENGGFELVLALFAGLAVVAVLGAGKLSADGLLGRRLQTA